MHLSIDRGSDVPIYRQIVNQVREAIRGGTLPAGYRLPPVRQVADDLGITRLTVYSAYSELQSQGLVESHVGRGTFVAAHMPQAGGDRPSSRVEWEGEGLIADLLRRGGQGDTVSFAQAFPDPGTVPASDLSRALQVAARTEGAFDYGPIGGYGPLRAEIAALLLDRSIAVSPDEVLITSGAQQGIDVILRACTEPGDTIAVEAPTYPGVLELAAQRGLQVAGIPADDGGIRVDALERALSAHRPRLLYLVPTCSNPTGHTLAPERRAAILRLARAHDMLIVEDDVYGFLPFDPPAPPALKREDEENNVLYLMSFSKMLAPGLRIGAVAAPPHLLPRLAAAKGSSDLFCSSLLQMALGEYLQGGHLHGHLKNVRKLYKERCAVMMAALDRFLPDCDVSRPQGGLSLWVRLPDGVSERDFVADALKRSVAVLPGRALFAEAQGESFMRLSYGTEPWERIERGVMALAETLEAHRRRGSVMLSLARGTAGPLV